MVVGLVLLLVSLVGVGVTLTVPAFADQMLLAGLCALAGLFVLLRGMSRRVALGERFARDRQAAQQWIVVDGSNVMHWKDSTPKIETLREVLAYLTDLGFSPGVAFDANAGYLISGQYLHHAAFAKLLGLPEDQVIVVAKGTPADATVLAAARDLGARIVTNDRYRDWADQHPEVRVPGHLIYGGYRDGKLWLNIAKPAQ